MGALSEQSDVASPTHDSAPAPLAETRDVPSFRSLGGPGADAVLDAVPCLIVVADLRTGAVVHVNEAVLAATERTEHELLGHAWRDVLEPADRAALRSAVSGPGSPALGVETTLRNRRGERRRVLWSLSLAEEPPEVPRAAGPECDAPRHLVLSGIDVTPELRTSGLFSQLVRTAVAPALVGTDLMGRVTLYNSVAERMLGYPTADMIGRVIPQALFDEDEFAERAERLGVSADLRLLAADLSKLDRRRTNLDLGSLDRRRPSAGDRSGGGRSQDRRAGEPGERRGVGAADRRGGYPEDRRGGSVADRRDGSGRRPQARDWTLVSSDGQKFTASLAVLPVTDLSGAVIGYLGVAEDVTEQRRSRNLLVAGLEKEAEAVRRLQALDRAKDDFVATVSHELRTPITSIMGYVELLLDSFAEVLDPTQMNMLEAVQRNGDRLRTLADNLLTLSSFESGEFTLHTKDVDLREVVQRAEEALRPLIADRRLDTTFTAPTSPVPIHGDAAHLERVLFNLLSNALKFTEDGGSIACVLTIESGEAVLRVSDTGIGIPEEEQERIFTRFFRSSNAQQRAIQGTGMGLAIVASIVERHEGRVRLTSLPKSGTIFSIHLPLLAT